MLKFYFGKGKFADLGKNGNRKAENDEQKL
ncbi:hypothetical protein SAMN05720469_10251 [Fibrobacter intestinalis]|uniref:Uncharacterized protein n=1 Tax=Fibrobacter intestinalis TaxID=28122 RepID=A0A1M6QDB2_9BACT|nr:hypothetical protein SAMN05720469_10251 [Fibrobacter intestinalis]